MIHATISGNLGRDPELRDAGGTQLLKLRLASSSRAKVDGTWQKQTTWIDVALFGRRAEQLAQMLVRGSYVTVRGELTQREYTHNGEKRTSLDMRADDVELGPKQDRPAQASPERQGGLSGTHYDHDATGGFPDDDDIPFD